MNRQDEYMALRQELEQLPQGLEQTVHRATQRLRRSRRLTAVKAVLASAALLMVTFTVLVNTFPFFAYACGQIPLIKGLAQAVAFSPSLSAAVENQYVQPIELEQKGNDITARVEYVIVDQKQVNIFYTLDSKKYGHLRLEADILAGQEMAQCAVTSMESGGNGELNHIALTFIEQDVPSSLQLTMKIYDRGEETFHEDEEPIKSMEHWLLKDWEPESPDYLYQPTFNLEFDPYYTSQGDIITLNQTFELAGQHLILSTVEIYPTHMRLNFADDPDNTAWLKNLSFYLEDEQGQRFDPVTNGISASGVMDSPMMASYHMESSYFADSTHLTLHITQATWLDKDKERIYVDLVNAHADHLPQNMELLQTKRYGDDWIVTAVIKRHESRSSYNPWSGVYYDLEGEQHDLDSSATGGGSYFNESTQQYIALGENEFYTEIPLRDYADDGVYLCPSFTHIVDLPEEVIIVIK